MYRVVITKKAEKQLSGLDRLLQERILNSFERIKFRPFHFVKRKQGTPYYILRIGKYRAILRIQNKKLIILVLELGLRRNIYKY